MTIHTVRAGDSIYSIAREYGVPPTRIITDNLLENPSRLAVGEDIVILFPTITHTVRGGENLNSISEMYGVDLLKLYQNNPILGGRSNVYPGQVLNIEYRERPLGDISMIGYAYPAIDDTVLRRTLPYLTYLSIFSYGITENGELILPQITREETPEAAEERLISTSREYRTVPLLTLTTIGERGTFSDVFAARLLSDPSLQQTVIDNVVETVRSKGYGGVDVDFEYIPEENAEQYASFVSHINEALGENYTVTVSLAPKYRSDQPGLLYGGHNYRLLGEAADNTLLMTYEWGYTYGPPLPVAPLNEVRRVVDYAVTEIPRDKILLGIPNYGYDWALPYERGVTRAENIGNIEAVARALERGAAIEYDETAQSPFFRYYDRPETYSDAVEHIVWFENARSSEAKLRLVSEYGLYGAGVWNIMKYYPSLWLVLNSLYEIRKE
ncbi:MAG: LysM peptidoglycan-binding domain-containing protein [Ruminococcaceae bacterium]|nr:LysM peptidoglycan-binding domain-containing protein [Oscillospiraceae bacterium]